MASNFPNSASVGQQFTVNGVTREWNGTAWISVATTVAGPQGPVGPTSVAASVTYATTSGSTQQTTFSNMNVSGNLNVTGNIYQSGSIVTISASNLEVADSVIYLSASNYNADLLDIGFYGAYGSGSYVGTASHKHTGLIRDHTDSFWKLFSFGTEPYTGVIDFTTANYDTLKLGGIIITSSALVSNLNAQYLNGQSSTDYLNTINSASLNAYNAASAFAISADQNYYASAQSYANSASLNAYASAVAVSQTYSNSASLSAYNAASSYALSAANAASSTAYNAASAYAISADNNYYASAQSYANSASLNSYISASAYTQNLVSSSYQPLDTDLTSIASLTSSGILKRTASSTWLLDVNYKQLYVSSSSPTTPEIGTLWINPSETYIISSIDGGTA